MLTEIPLKKNEIHFKYNSEVGKKLKDGKR